MSLTLTDNARAYVNRTSLVPNIVLKIAGYDTIIGAVTIKKFIKIGDPGLLIGSSWAIGGVSEVENQRSYISLNGTTTTINQQLRQDEGAASSVSSVQIEIIDKDNFMTSLITPGAQITDILATKATLYFGFKETAWPEDYIPIFKGIIDDISAGLGTVTLNIAHPDQKKRQRIFEKAETKLNGTITDADVTITVTDTSSFLTPPADTSFQTYIQIDDEIIRYTGVTATTFTGCTRAQFNTLAAAHDDQADVASRYRLTGNSIDLALKIMLSGDGSAYISGLSATSFVAIGTSGTDPNGIFFNAQYLSQDYNVVIGDTVTITGSASNNGTYTVTSVNLATDGTYITVDSALTYEVGSSGLASFVSKYDMLGEGVGMDPDDVDITAHTDLQTTFGSVFPNYDFLLTDTIDNAKTFIEKQIYFPAALYSLPRKSRASLGFTNPPLSPDELKIFDLTNTVKPESVKIRRSLNRFFYNQVVYQYDQNYLDSGKYLRGYVRQDADSINRINGGAKSLFIQSDGLRKSAENDVILEVNSRRFLERYRYGAENITGVQVFFRDGFNLEVGDVVLFGSAEMQISDVTQGTRDFNPRLFEIQNRRLDIKTGNITLDLIDTNFLSNARYGVISPSSKVDSGSTTSAIILVDGGFGTVSVSREKDKWTNYVGEEIIVHDPNYALSQTATFTGFDPGNPLKMLVTGLSTAPNVGDIVDIPPYPSTASKRDNALYKAIHAFFDPQVAVASGTSSTIFNVGAGDASKFFVGGVIRVHNLDFSVDSGDVNITDVTGTQVTCQDLGFTPSSSELVDLIGFPDEGSPYRLI